MGAHWTEAGALIAAARRRARLRRRRIALVLLAVAAVVTAILISGTSPAPGPGTGPAEACFAFIQPGTLPGGQVMVAAASGGGAWSIDEPIGLPPGAHARAFFGPGYRQFLAALPPGEYAVITSRGGATFAVIASPDPQDILASMCD
jgi:hypothetical protein